MKPRVIYAETLEATALEQFESAMEQDFVVRGALMPDAHTGYSLPIGAVIATKDVVVPSWVGYDIGCGVAALRLDGIDAGRILGHRKEIFDKVYEYIPVGFNLNQRPTSYCTCGLTPQGTQIAISKQYKHALGSLGGGNHFIEIGVDGYNYAWVVIHSGSRGVGHGIATHYMGLANPEGKCKDGHHGFDVNSQNGRDYIQDMTWCLKYALDNRKEMIIRVVEVITKILDIPAYAVHYSKLINRNHNHAEKRGDLWIHRKGATHAEDGMMGVIPGNMRDGSFIVRGRGNPDSLWSSSHGAGRVLGRKEAKRTLDIQDFKAAMGNVTALVDESTLDEAPMAYKDISEVMHLQRDLVEVCNHITPMINIKG